MEYKNAKNLSTQGGVIPTFIYENGQLVQRKQAFKEVDIIIDGVTYTLDKIIREHIDMKIRLEEAEYTIEALKNCEEANVKALNTILDYIKVQKEREV